MTNHSELSELRNAGFQIVTGKKDEKRPNVLWKGYQNKFISDAEFNNMLAEKDEGLYCLITGEISNVVVIDVDSSDIYDNYFKEFEDKTIVVQTPSGGFHLWFSSIEYPKTSTNYNGFPIDIRGKKGIAIVPPSVSESGEYTWINKNNLKPMQINKIGDILKGVPQIRDSGVLKDQLNRFYKDLNVGGFDIIKIANILNIKDIEPIGHGNYKSQCIFINHKTPNQEMEIYTSTNTVFCHGCDKSGDIIDMVMLVKNIKMSEAIVWLEMTSGIASKIDFAVVSIKNTHIQNLCEIGAKGRITFKRMEIAKFLIDKFKALISNKYMYIYDDTMGIYRLDYGGIFETELNEMFGDHINKQGTAEIMAKVFNYPGNEFKELETMWVNEDFVCLKNGVFDIKNHKLVAHSPKFYFLSQLQINYDENAKCPMLNKMMNNIFNEKQLAEEYEWLGYCLTGGNRYKLMSFYLGVTNSGKSTYFKVINKIFGNTNIASIEPQNFSKEFYSFGLFGKMLNIAGDIGTHKIMGFHKLKQLTGDDIIMANIKGKPMVNFINNAKMMFGMNRIPPIDDTTTAGYNRIRQINLERDISNENQKDWNFKNHTTDVEMSGFFNLMIDGLYRLNERGRFDLKPLEERIEEIENTTNSMFIWQPNCIEFTGIDTDKVFLKNLFESYEEWYKATGLVIPLSKHGFATDFRKAFNQKYLFSKNVSIYGKTGAGFTGILILEEEEPIGFADVSGFEDEKSYTNF